MSDADARTVSWQLGRNPRGRWRVVSRCSHDAPTVIATSPGPGDAPFPTLYYLTCPHLVSRVSDEESRGGCGRWRALLAGDEELLRRLQDADTAYREARAAEGGGTDVSADVGIGGERDILGVKCLHTHVAAFLAGIDDPVGETLMYDLERECDDGRCKEVI